MVKVSIIAPTFQRERHHGNLYGCFARQTHPDCELLILDDSPTPSSFFTALQVPRVKYVHSPHKMNIGEKRNALIEMAEGDIIVHFDDDDYYAPHYVETMVAALGSHDLVKLSGWFAYSVKDQKLFYWDTSEREPIHFIVLWDGVSRGGMSHILHEYMYAHHWGFGFSYVYRRTAWENNRFEPIDMGEDFNFLTGLQEQGAKVKAIADSSGLVLHCQHDKNVSGMFPQYYLPPFMMDVLFGEQIKPYLAFPALTGEATHG